MQRAIALLLCLSLPAGVYAMSLDRLHTDPIAPVILGVTLILFVAVLGRYAARRCCQPSVLGELLMGVIIGNLAYLFGFDFIEVLREGPVVFELLEHALASQPLPEAAIEVFGAADAARILAILQSPNGIEYLQVAHVVDVFSRYGVIFLLFLVGLESSVEELQQVGGDSLRVAIIGMAVPFLLGFTAARVLMPELSLNVDLFVAATLGATSIGITARVLQDMGVTRSREARIVLGAAVMDDVLGLLLLAIVSGIVVSGGVELDNILVVAALSSLFIVSAFVVGPYFLNFTINMVSHLDVMEAKLFISLLFVMVLAWLANLVGLATIVGAFAAGLILHEGYFHHWDDAEHHRRTIKELVAPIESILVPIFFVLMGLQVKLETFFDLHVIAMAMGLLLAAILGKVVSGLGVLNRANRMAIGIGMMPRGEVGLIFASIGKSLGVISDELFSAVVLMVIVTTLITPPLLKLALREGTVDN